MFKTVKIGLFIIVWLCFVEECFSVEYFDAMPQTCKIDNWGLPKQTTKTYNPNYDQILRIPCQKQWSKTRLPFSKAHKMATAIHYKDTPSYDSFQAVDWIPENKKLYSKGSSWGKEKNTDFHTKSPYSFMSSECKLENEDGSEWAVTRIGPIITTGGYDWLQIGWDNIWNFQDILNTHTDGVHILEQIISPIWANGTMINHPPIHIHHMHIGPAPYVRQRFDQLQCATRGKGCFNPARTLEDHGDYNCIEADGGLNCRMESFPDGYGKLIEQEMGVEGELNDVRPANSPPLEWYFILGARWIPKTIKSSSKDSSKSNSPGSEGSSSSHLRPMSLENIAGPGTYSLFHQKEYLLTFPTPTKYDAIFWYTGRMQSKGDLLRMKIHAHNTIFEEALVFAASPEDLGLTEDNGFMHSLPYIPVRTKDIRDFRNNHDAKHFILNSLSSSQAIYDKQQQQQHTQNVELSADTKQQSKCGYPDGPCSHVRPDIVCQMHGALEIVPEPNSLLALSPLQDRIQVSTTSLSAALNEEGISSLTQSSNRAWYSDYAYDRRSPTCCLPWQWESGQPFTVVGFTRYKGFPLSGRAVTDTVPETVAGHVGFWMSYDEMSTPATYHWGYSLYNHYEDGSLRSVADMKGYQKIAIAFNGGTSEHWNDPEKEPYYLVAYFIYLVLTNLPAVGGILLLSACWCCGRAVCPRGNVRPLALKDTIFTCYGLCDPDEIRLAIPLSRKPEKPYLSSSIHVEIPTRTARRGNDLEEQEEKMGLLL